MRAAFLCFVILLSLLSCKRSGETSLSESPRLGKNQNLIRDTIAQTIITDSAFDYNLAMDINSYIPSYQVPFNKTTQVDYACAVYVNPNSETIELLRKKWSEQDFNTIVDDEQWYNYESGQLLDTLGIKMINLETRYIEFRMSDGESIIIDAKAPLGNYWNLFFFNPDKKPRVVSPVALSRDSVKVYFDLK